MLEWARAITGASRAARAERVQALWDGYGEIVRVQLEGAATSSVIVKSVQPPRGRGRSHARKLRSYAVERAWYERYASRCDEHCRVARCLAVDATEGGWRFLFEDLDAAGFPSRRGAASAAEIDACLRWLASFHARFLDDEAVGLWETGTYWHLETRPDELAAIADASLREAAARIDARLRGAPHPTLVHGDAKLANFCFAPDGVRAAAVDFQYVGRGCAMSDVAYFLFSAHGWGDRDASDAHIERYFDHLRVALARERRDAAAVEREWRALYPYARADFLRFYAGWAPSPGSVEDYRRAVAALP